MIYRGPVRLVDLVRRIKPDCKIPDDPVYWKVYRRIKRLAALGYVQLERRERIDWQATIDQRMEEIEKSVHSIFAAAVQGNPPRTVSSATPPTEPGSGISTVKKAETGFTVVPTANLFTLLSRVQNSNRFLNPAKVRTESGQLRQSLADQKVQRRRKCPYYLGARTRGIRIDAVFKLLTVRRHSYFRRRDKKFVNPELVTDLNFIQDRYEEYADQVRDLKCALVHKENGSIKLIDYQTRFTDESRQDQTIARFHHSWEKASQSFNTAVFLTLTSYPPSEAPKQHYRQSLWHVDRHYGEAWNAYMSKLEKRERAARRDELLNAMRDQVRKVRKVKEVKERCWHCRGTGKISLKIPCQKCSGEGYRIRIRLTREERQKALEPMKDQSFRPKYLQVYEFQKNGMIHGHCVIFGRHWLDSFEQIKQDWQLTGQGERIHVYALHKEGDVWQWSKAAPADSRNRQPVDYLGKYLGKGIKLKSSHGMYWAINKRFFTNSRALTGDQDLPPELENLPAQYEYLGSFKGFDLPPWLISGPRQKATAGGKGGGWLDPLGFGRDSPPGVPA